MNDVMNNVLVANEATCSVCGHPVRNCTCKKATVNQSQLVPMHFPGDPPLTATCNKATANANGLVSMPFPGDDGANLLPVVNHVRNPNGGPDLVCVPFPGETLM